jgi:prolyl 4-hydroxylase
MAIKPHKAQAVLFYSQFPDGNVDRLSIHGGCPVLVGTKWAANLWVWNGPRNGYPQRKRGQVGAEGVSEPHSPVAVKATFQSEVDAGVHLYWQDQDWGPMVPNSPIKVNTFEGHEWSLRLHDEVFASWTVGGEEEQLFLLTEDDLPKQ